MGTEKRRKKIPLSVKLEVALRHLGFKESEINWDHTPPLALRQWDPRANDTIPPANDPEHIQILPVVEHKAKTTGRRGESDKNAIHGDVAEIARLKRLTKEHEEFNRRLLSKGSEEEPRDGPEKKSRWPKRPFNSRGRREESKTRPEKGSRGLGGGRHGRRLPLRQLRKAQAA